MNFMNYYRRLAHYKKKHGIRTLVRSIILLMWRRTFKDRKIIFYIDLLDWNESEVHFRSDITVKDFQIPEDIPPEDLLLLYRHKGGVKLVHNHYFKKNFSKGGTLWLAYLNNDIVGWQWTCRNGFNGFYFFPSTSHDAVFFDSEIFPEYRGRGINPAMLLYMFAALKKKGIRRVYGDVYEWNTANIKSLPKSGMKMIGFARELNILGKKHIIWYRKEFERLQQKHRGSTC